MSRTERKSVVQEYDEVEDLQRGERVPVRVQDPKLSTPREVDEHKLTHFANRSWCCHCVRGEGKTMEHRKGHREKL